MRVRFSPWALNGILNKYEWENRKF